MSDKIKYLTDDSFDNVVMAKNQLTLVDFWASWCGPCRMLAPLLDKLAEEYDGKVVVAKVNVDDCEVIATRYNIMSIPTIYIFKDGIIIEKLIGLRTEKDLKEILDKNL